jgi:MoaA/NifB/PqqE/SkfB family radical SAM enzyme
MKQNYSVVPMLFNKELSLSAKMSWGFIKMGKSWVFPKRDFNYNHMKNLCLVYFKLTPLCNLRCAMCGQWGDKGVMKNCDITEENKKLVSLEQYKKLTDEIAPQRPIVYLWGGEPFL